MSAPKKTRLNLYGYEVLRVRDPQAVDPVLDGKNTGLQKSKKKISSGTYILVSLFYIFCMYIAGFHSFRAYATNERYDYIHRMFFAVLFAPFYILYVILKTNVHALFGLTKGADLITMRGTPYYLHN